jgi:chlorite dismutase
MYEGPPFGGPFVWSDMENETGLYVSHLMVSFPTDETQFDVVNEFARVIEKSKLASILESTKIPEVQIITAASFGHESDAIVMVLAHDAKTALDVEHAIKNCGVIVVDSFFSLTETSEYMTSEEDEQKRVDALETSAEEKTKMMDEWRSRMSEYKQHRLYPHIPPKEFICFYPMSKKREDGANWYALDFETRARYMRAHGTVGRRYSGKILQLITGATGLTDWEWGVTLFADSLVDVKDIVYEMRFDNASALFGEFGHFTIGKICEPDQILG